MKTNAKCIKQMNGLFDDIVSARMSTFSRIIWQNNRFRWTWRKRGRSTLDLRKFANPSFASDGREPTNISVRTDSVLAWIWSGRLPHTSQATLVRRDRMCLNAIQVTETYACGTVHFHTSAPLSATGGSSYGNFRKNFN
jgi:hypothetical protein